jgi:hypothetical protein
LGFAVSLILFFLVILWQMYKRKIFVKVWRQLTIKKALIQAIKAEFTYVNFSQLRIYL